MSGLNGENFSANNEQVTHLLCFVIQNTSSSFSQHHFVVQLFPFATSVSSSVTIMKFKVLLLPVWEIFVIPFFPE